MGEDKKFDFNSIIGVLLIGAVILWWLHSKKEEAERQKEQKTKTEHVAHAAADSAATRADTVSMSGAVAQGNGADTTALPSAQKGLAGLGNQPEKNDTTVLENNLLKIGVSNKGGQIVQVLIKGEMTYDSLPVYLIKGNNASLGLRYTTLANKKVKTENLYFRPSLTKNGGNTVLTMKARIAPEKYLAYIYTLKPDSYLVDFTIRTQGFKNFISSAQPVDLKWKLKGHLHDKSHYFETRYTNADYYYEGNKHSKKRSGTTKEKDISWVAYRQHFFTSVLLNNNTFEKGKIKVTKLDADKDSLFTKSFASTFPLKLKGGELNADLGLYFGPTDYKLLKSYGHHLKELVPLGWGIIGWINKFIFIPIFRFLMSFLPAGLAIIVLTIIVKVIASPVQYKQLLAQAKRKILKPELDEIQEKYEGNKMKVQQETMKLNRKAGINQTSGCLFGLIQAPIFFALYELFPNFLSLRHQSFLWAKDLSSYDSIWDLPFRIPVYGDHVSLFALLAAVAILIYMTLTTGQTMQNMPQQKGMPNMKYLMYISPIAMLLFFNRYPSGMALYYTTSNVISICIYMFIQKFIIDENKVHAKIQEHKKKPQKTSKFRQRMQAMMEEAEQQKNTRK